MISVIGLGNPTKQHAGDRHNVGWQVLDALAEKGGLVFEERSTFHAHLSSDSELLLVKPTTWMNDSGLSAKKLFQQYKTLPVLVYDEINVNLGEVKCSPGGGSGGHNGVQSVIDHLGTKDFFRIRIGVRPVHEELQKDILPPDGFEKFLLKPFAPFEAELKEKGIQKAVKIIEALKRKNFNEVMTEFN